MSRGPLFVEWDTFQECVAEGARTLDGSTFIDVRTAYGDMSRLVVAWLATADPADVRRMYNELGWGGCANVRQIQQAAQYWMREHREAMPQGN